ncbi:hypothetical protein IFR23_12695 [Sphingomonas sp. CFBP 13603]|uniref:hypothetical protein n=1 Tax=Sphingomonas sp. CFBP 13603 TaxID=2774040 RepID=UPI001865D6D3|nr:hypothetical protein [Sphingomonas sp. CFBP 13603]MBE2992872.1 hypothetical protein [Sphingomonas sp. CFBP 13603]
MKLRMVQVFVLAVVSVLYWLLVSHVSGAKEPWDAAGYWLIWYPGSLLLSACGGFAFGKRGWSAGAIVTFAQLPVMWVNTGFGGLLIVGVAFLAVLAVPAVILSALFGRLRATSRRNAGGRKQHGAI